MAYTLDLKHEYVSYVARFAKPEFELWGRGDVIVRGLYDAFSPFDVPFSNFQVSGAMTNAADPAVTVTIGSVGTSKFAFDRVESIFANFTEDFFQSIPKILAASTSWIRGAVPSLKFTSHHFVYFTHSLLKNANVDDFLRTFNPKVIKSAGQTIGNGMIFNQIRPDWNWKTQLLLDRSTIIQDGLYVSLTITVKTNAIDYDSLFAESRTYFATMLGELDLQLPELSQ